VRGKESGRFFEKKLRKKLLLEHDRFKSDHALTFFTEGDSRLRRAQVSAPQTIAL